MSYVYCCPFCGEELIELFDKPFCPCCEETIEEPYKSKYDHMIYVNKTSGDWRALLTEEISENPLFDQNKYQHRLDLEKKIANRNRLATSCSSNKNKPKCPTCGSTNITKISTTSKVAGAVAFGLFSKTAKSQFKCNNCGYKW